MTDRKDSSDKEERLNELLKGEEIYRTDEGRMVATRQIIKEYIQIKGIKINPSTVKDPSDLIIDIVSKDKEFRYFAFSNYHVYIEYNEDLEMFFIHKTTDEMLELISKSSEEDLDTKQLFDELCYLEDRLYHPEKK
jgi:hypothetical protein